MPGLSIATDRPLRALDDRYRDLFTRQAERLIPKLAALTDQQWQARSRNEDWTVQQTMQHVAGIRIENIRVFGGEEPTWSADFDPNRSPQQDIDTRAGESPDDTLDGFVDTVEPFLAHLASRSTSDERTPMLWGELADFRLFFLHLHWDSWVHERDMLLPLGIDHEPDAESLRFATAYGLLIAGVAVRMNGGQIEVPIDIGDLGPARLSVTADAVAVDIGAAAESSDAYTARDAATLVDALGGRGNVADALECPSNVGAELSLIGAFLHG